jgi:hypothetical protein
MEKNKLLRECKKILSNEKYQNWYSTHLYATNQGNTVEIVRNALDKKEITLEQALFTTFITGLQWSQKFPNTP